MKMWFTEGCFFRNFPRWEACSALLSPCPGCPVLWAALGQRQGLLTAPGSWGQPQNQHRKAGCCFHIVLWSQPARVG